MLLLAEPRPACATATFDALHYIPGSTFKVEQLIGDHDWADTTRATASLTAKYANVLGNDIGYSFLHGDSLIMLCGDTIGKSSTYVPTWALPPVNKYKWSAADPIAWSRTMDPDSALLLHFFMKTVDTTLTVTPRYANGALLDMSGDDVPNSGISLDGQIYLICSTGSIPDSAGPGSHANDSSVVVHFDIAHQTFAAGRTMSQLPGGHFVTTALRELPMQFANSPSDSEVMIFGLGPYRKSDVYLAKIPKSQFESGLNSHGKSATKYFTGLVNGVPGWSDLESAAVPIVQDNPLLELGVGLSQQPWPNDSATIGNVSVVWCPALSLWLMTFDGGRQSPSARLSKQTTGIYFTYATTPWGPWMGPQLIFNSTRDAAFGTFVRTYSHDTGVGAGPAGPTSGVQTTNDPDTTSGALYAPELIEPFIRVSGDTLKIDYTTSTWNPYTIVRMRSAFIVVPGQSLGVPAEPASTATLALRPNPFHAATQVSFTLPHAGPAEVAVYDLSGRLVRTLHRGALKAGEWAFAWDGNDNAGASVRAGVYFVRLQSASEVLATRAVRVR